VNPRQRRGALLVAVAIVGAIAVFFSVLSFVSEVNSKVGDLVTVVALTDDVAPYEQISPDDLELVEVPRRWMPGTAITDAGDVVGLVSQTGLPKGTYAQQGMFTNRPGVQNGYREVAILVDAETGVAGKIQPGNHVDMLVTLAAREGSSDNPAAPRAQVWVTNALVINVGVVETVDRQSPSGGLSEGKAVPVTFAEPIKDALKVAYAESFAVKVRLALRGGGDESEVPEGDRIFIAPEGDGA
jgi:pilus assembly protein CpaB